jgi:hypothetical protein
MLGLASGHYRAAEAAQDLPTTGAEDNRLAERATMPTVATTAADVDPARIGRA